MLRYESGSTGESISLYSDNIKGRLKKAGFYKYEWNVKEIKRLIGSSVEAFGKQAARYELTLDFIGSKSERAKNADTFFKLTEIDVLNNKPGKLHFGEYYLNCYVIDSEAGGRDKRKRMVQKKVIIYAPYPFWIKEVSYYVPPVDIDGLLEINTVPASLENPHYAECDFLLKAYGPLDELFFYINDNQYRIVTSCKDGEYLLLDTRNETIVKVDSSGNKTNVYSTQVFTLDNFKKIPAGSNSIRYKRNYAIEITLFQERSEPKWNEAIPNTHFLIMTENNNPILTEDGYYLIGEEMVGGAI